MSLTTLESLYRPIREAMMSTFSEVIIEYNFLKLLLMVGQNKVLVVYSSSLALLS